MLFSPCSLAQRGRGTPACRSPSMWNGRSSTTSACGTRTSLGSKRCVEWWGALLALRAVAVRRLLPAGGCLSGPGRCAHLSCAGPSTARCAAPKHCRSSQPPCCLAALLSRPAALTATKPCINTAVPQQTIWCWRWRWSTPLGALAGRCQGPIQGPASCNASTLGSMQPRWDPPRFAPPSWQLTRGCGAACSQLRRCFDGQWTTSACCC
jgi:hypothetical protein